jgi:hypothetical protein
MPYKDPEKRRERQRLNYIKNIVHIKAQSAEHRKTVAAKKMALAGAKKHALLKREIVEGMKVSKGCALCGYNKCAESLHFHHPDPSSKSFSQFARKGLPKVIEETKKCIVLCANCHAEEHVKMRRTK